MEVHLREVTLCIVRREVVVTEVLLALLHLGEVHVLPVVVLEEVVAAVQVVVVAADKNFGVRYCL